MELQINLVKTQLKDYYLMVTKVLKIEGKEGYKNGKSKNSKNNKSKT